MPPSQAVSSGLCCRPTRVWRAFIRSEANGGQRKRGHEHQRSKRHEVHVAVSSRAQQPPKLTFETRIRNRVPLPRSPCQAGRRRQAPVTSPILASQVPPPRSWAPLPPPPPTAAHTHALPRRHSDKEAPLPSAAHKAAHHNAAQHPTTPSPSRTYPNMTALHFMISLSQGAPLMPLGGSCGRGGARSPPARARTRGVEKESQKQTSTTSHQE